MNNQIRVFLSSTFIDMHMEREYLVKHTFPLIERLCNERGLSFCVVDLRWGVTEEESKGGKVVEICFDEIERTRPFFIGIVGNRYGWIPGKEDCESYATLIAKYPMLARYISENRSLTEMEMLFGALESEKKVNALFCLKNEATSGSQLSEESRYLDEHKLSDLKSKIRARASEGIVEAISFDHVKELGEKVVESLTSWIDEKYPYHRKKKIANMASTQQRRLEELRDGYVEWSGCQELERAIANDGPGIRPDIFTPGIYAVRGNSGSGKSTFAANWETPRLDIPIYRTFVTSDSCTIGCQIAMVMWKIWDKDSLRNVIESLGTDTTFEEYAEFDEFPKDPFIWIVDGIENFVDDMERDLSWLSDLPENCTLIMTVNDRQLESIIDLRDDCSLFNLSPLAAHQREVMVRTHLKNFAKSLTDAQRIHICHNQLTGNPLLLKIMLNQLLQFGVHEQLDSYIESLLSHENEENFYKFIIKGWEHDFGQELIKSLLLMLRNSFSGIKEVTLQRILNLNRMQWAAVYGAINLITTDKFGYISLYNPAFIAAIDSLYGKETCTMYDSMLIASIRESRQKVLYGKEVPFFIRLFNRCNRILTGVDSPMWDGDAGKITAMLNLDESRLHIANGRYEEGIKLLFGSLMVNDAIFGLRSIVGIFDMLIQNGVDVLKITLSPQYARYAKFAGTAFSHWFCIIINHYEKLGVKLDVENVRQVVKSSSYPKKVKRELLSFLNIKKECNKTNQKTFEQGEIATDLSIMEKARNVEIFVYDKKELEEIYTQAKENFHQMGGRHTVSCLCLMAICEIRLGLMDEARVHIKQIVGESPSVLPLCLRYKVLLDLHSVTEQTDPCQLQRDMEHLVAASENKEVAGEEFLAPLRLMVAMALSKLQVGNAWQWFDYKEYKSIQNNKPIVERCKCLQEMIARLFILKSSNDFLRKACSLELSAYCLDYASLEEDYDSADKLYELAWQSAMDAENTADAFTVLTSWILRLSKEKTENGKAAYRFEEINPRYINLKERLFLNMQHHHGKAENKDSDEELDCELSEQGMSDEEDMSEQSFEDIISVIENCELTEEDLNEYCHMAQEFIDGSSDPLVQRSMEFRLDVGYVNALCNLHQEEKALRIMIPHLSDPNFFGCLYDGYLGFGQEAHFLCAWLYMEIGDFVESRRLLDEYLRISEEKENLGDDAWWTDMEDQWTLLALISYFHDKDIVGALKHLEEDIFNIEQDDDSGSVVKELRNMQFRAACYARLGLVKEFEKMEDKIDNRFEDASSVISRYAYLMHSEACMLYRTDMDKLESHRKWLQEFPKDQIAGFLRFL